MKLSVVTSSLLTAKPVWFDETDEDIVQGCIASGAIAPLVWPAYVRKQWFVDGGVFHNTPIIQALKRGATNVLVICLDADEHVPLDNKTLAGQNVGPDIVNYYIQVATQEYMVKNGHEELSVCELAISEGNWDSDGLEGGYAVGPAQVEL